MKIELNGLDIQNKQDFYNIMKEKLDFPDYFGNNLDALYDVLTEREPDLTVEFVNYDKLEESLGSKFLRQLKRVFEDAGVTTRRDYDEHGNN